MTDLLMNEETTSANANAEYYNMETLKQQIFEKYSKRIICLLPKQCRQIIQLTIPKKIDNQDKLYEMFNLALEKTYWSSKIYIVSVKLDNNSDNSNNSNNNSYAYNIVYFIVPKELVHQFENTGAYLISYYIGHSDNITEYQISDNPPTLDMICATENNVHLPFSWPALISN